MLGADAQVSVEGEWGDNVMEQVRGAGPGLVGPIGMGSAGHEIIPGSLWGRLGQQRRLNIDEAIGIHEVAHGVGDLGAKPQALQHLGTA